MRLGKKLLSVFLLLWLSLSFFSPLTFSLVYAQEATESAVVVEPTVLPSITPETSPTSEPVTPTTTPSNTQIEPEVNITDTIPLIETIEDFQPDSGLSASIKGKPVLRRLDKKDYLLNEKVRARVTNAGKDDIAVSVIHENGMRLSVLIEEEEINNEVFLTIHPPQSLTPGNYTLEVTDFFDQKLTQDFTWGVLAINPNKSLYYPQEEAYLAMAVLDEYGNMVCDASVTLQIKSQSNGVEDTLSTKEGSIKVNEECWKKSITNKPDYEATYRLKGVGKYYLTLTAETSNGSHTIEDIIEVRDFIPFDIERITATRIFPPEIYPVELKIKVNQDFEGIIEEYVPQEFVISKPEGDLRAYDEIELAEVINQDEPSLDIGIPTLSMPFKGDFQVSTGFGENYEDKGLVEKVIQFLNLKGHDGVDFMVTEGNPILAVDEGEVIFAGDGDYGLTVIVAHAWGTTYYGHLSSINVEENKYIEQGYKLGEAGSTGISTGPHLHFSLLPLNPDLDNGYEGMIDPLPYLDLARESQVLGITNEPNKVQVIRWQVSLQKGQEITLGYNYDAPDISPQFYLLGPLTFKISKESLEIVFSENRKWQIAADAISFGASTGQCSKNTDTSTISSFATGTLSNRIMVVMVTIDSPDSISSLDWSLDTGETFLNVSGATADDGTNESQIWYYTGYTQGTGDLTVNLGSRSDVCFGVGTFGGVDTGSPIDSSGNNTGTGTTLTASATVVGSNTWGVGVTRIDDDEAISETGDQSQLFDALVGVNDSRGHGSYDASVGTGSQSMSWTTGASVNYAASVIFLDPVIVTGPMTDQQMRHGNWFDSGTEQGFTF